MVHFGTPFGALRFAVERPASLGGNQRFDNEPAEDDQQGVEHLTVQTPHPDGDQNRVSGKRRPEAFIHQWNDFWSLPAMSPDFFPASGSGFS